MELLRWVCSHSCHHCRGVALRITLTSHGYPPTVSGVTLVVQRLARALVSRGHSVTVIAGSDRFRAYESYDRGVRVIRLDSHTNPYWSANPVPTVSLEALQQLLERLRPEVIHAHDSLPFLLQLVRGRAHLGGPLVATCHYYPSFVASYLASREMTSELVETLAWRYTIQLYNRVGEIAFATFTHRDRFVQHGLTARSHIISNGVDTKRYSPAVRPLDLSSRY
ncbi:hypothetical protein EG835_08625, partial [bacterium]|nr:hypothetical protein [bacterium]